MTREDLIAAAPPPPFAFAAAALTLEQIRRESVERANQEPNERPTSPRDMLFALLKALGGVGDVLQRNRDNCTAKGTASAISSLHICAAVTEDIEGYWSAGDRALLNERMAAGLVSLVLLADECRVDLPTAAHEKMLKNARKYPPTVALAPLRVPRGAFSPENGATSTADFQFEATSTLELFRLKTAHFADERNWPRNLTPRNLLLALSAEVGELCELFQWRGDDTSPLEWEPDERVHLGEELSDVLLYLVQLADRSFTDLATAVSTTLTKDAAQPRDASSISQ